MPTPLLELRNIGKIYVSEGNVAVGIRGVNLSFDRGEFVAVTGKSGSGKSTLLNVLSGMDTYAIGRSIGSSIFPSFFRNITSSKASRFCRMLSWR